MGLERVREPFLRSLVPLAVKNKKGTTKDAKEREG
jgi:hypothetical protein